MSQTITLIAFGAIGLIPLFFQEAIKEAIKKMFSGLSPRQVTSLFVMLVGALVIIASATGFTFFGEDAAPVSSQVQVANPSKSPSDAEVYADLAKTGINVTEDLLDKKRNKDSILLANREKVWVYQIGMPKNSESDAWEAANAFANIPSICIFKESRKSYLLFQDIDRSKEMLEDSLAQFRSELEEILPGTRVKIIDLMSFCPKRKKLIESGKITRKKKAEQYKCMTCE